MKYLLILLFIFPIVCGAHPHKLPKEYCDRYGECYSGEYYNMTTGEKFDGVEYIYDTAKSYYNSFDYAMGSLSLQLFLGTTSKEKPTKEQSECINECLDRNEWKGRNGNYRLRDCIEKCQPKEPKDE